MVDAMFEESEGHRELEGLEEIQFRETLEDNAFAPAAALVMQGRSDEMRWAS
jgi:hypothetical protein